ncbi:hypothetical protein ABT297_17905 [Dactylosporangium sp. NPDC000555]|uniref:hypothetical protein n=1 Tax=Dactylosporangium sp. NPDC000555 TaxID=3154260 RepID=UPI00331DBF9B
MSLPVGIALLAGMTAGVAWTVAAVAGLAGPRVERFVATPAQVPATAWSWAGRTPPSPVATPSPAMGPDSDPVGVPERSAAGDGWVVP